MSASLLGADAPEVEDQPRGPAWVDVDLAAIRHNVRTMLTAGPPGAKLLAVVKADAYGHGATQVSRAALDAGAFGLAVARVREGVALRDADITAPVLVLGYTSVRELADVLANDLAITISDMQTAQALSALAMAAGRKGRVHVKVDTGMHRFGIMPEDAVEVAARVATLPGVWLEGIYTHYATADEEDSPVYAQQGARFAEVVHALELRGLRPSLVHAANSAAAMSGREPPWDAVRAGIALYGVQPTQARMLSLLPAMSLKAEVGRVLDVHEGEGVSYGQHYRAATTIAAAVVPCGYADGYMRSLGGTGEVLLGGRRCRVLGAVCMDSLVVGLPGDLEIAVGAEAVLLGSQGAERVSAEE
ncbi:MAG: alanine racemase, partial [Chloroflexota bacterium]|nr:alanine racemase [Chloroflexota bacterium]